MEPIEAIIRSELEHEHSIFVFPSEVVARAWQRRSLELTPLRAIRDRRFLSWDRFKEETFSLVRAERPVNRLARTLLSAALLEENRGGRPFLRTIVHPEHSAGSLAFVGTLSAILPQLGAAREIVAAAEREGRRLDPERIGDLALLWERYGAFLRHHGLFEPAYERIDISRLDATYFLFFPEVIEDYESFRAQLESPRIRSVPVPPPAALPILQFDNVVQELRWLIVSIADLLDHGVPPDEIAVTAPGLDRWGERLRAEAEPRGIRLDFRQGQPLGSYPQGRLFRAIGRCVRDRFSLAALKALLLDRAFPWRDDETGRTLVRFGIDRHCVGTIQEGHRDLWRENLHRAGAAELLAFYSGLHSEVEALLSAPSFGELKARLVRFVRGRLDTDRWSGSGRRVFEFCIRSLDEFVEVERTVPELLTPSPYSLWLDHLAERIYVERSAAGGVEVYPYRVSAGIPALHHFIVGANQRATTVEWPQLPFLTAEERARLAIEDRPFTENFLALYLQSGRNVHVSYSREDESGPQLAPGYFVSTGRVSRFGENEAVRERDPISREASVWRGESAPPTRVFALQKQALETARATAWTPKGIDLTSSPIGDPQLKAQLLSLLEDGEGFLTVSPTRLEAYWSCPFAFLFAHTLKVQELSFEIDPVDPKLVGNLIHQALGQLFARIKSGALQASAPAHELVREVVERLCADWETQPHTVVPVPPVWVDLREKLIVQLDALLEVERRRFGGYEVEALEATFELSDPQKRLRLEGRIDRVSRGSDGALVVDYKKHTLVSMAQIRGEEGKRPSSFQIPFYVWLLEHNGIPVVRAGYYDVEGGRYRPVLDAEPSRSRPLMRAELDVLLRRLETSIDEMAASVRAGIFCAPAEASGCEACSLRSLCRKRFTVRLSS